MSAIGEASLPRGYDHVRRDIAIGGGVAAFEAAAEALMTWRKHRAAGLGVTR